MAKRLSPDAPPGAGLERGALDPDPIRQFATWFRPVLARDTDATAMTLATVDKDGGPSARTVLLKDFDERGFVFYTNYRSPKARALADHPRAALVFHWPDRERQVCVSGPVIRVSDEESDAYFLTRPRESQLGAWASPQSEVIASREELDHRVAEFERRFAGREVPRPPYWGGFRLAPDVVEFWQGRPSRLHDRFRYRKAAGGWVIERLAP
jgi:pyridoxamine 5'-phosphate oxidase